MFHKWTLPDGLSKRTDCFHPQKCGTLQSCHLSVRLLGNRISSSDSGFFWVTSTSTLTCCSGTKSCSFWTISQALIVEKVKKPDASFIGLNLIYYFAVNVSFFVPFLHQPACEAKTEPYTILNLSLNWSRSPLFLKSQMNRHHAHDDQS